MKTSLLKKIIAITLSLTLIISCMMIAAPHIHAADSIDFLMDGDKRVGIKQITIDGRTYYDIDGGNSSIDPDKISPVEFYKKAMLADNGGYSAIDLWANIASSIYESAGSGIGWNPEKDFDKNLFQAFSSENSFSGGNLVTTGWTVGTTLKVAQDKMVSEFVREYGDTVELNDFLSSTTGNSSGFGLLNNSTRQTVLYNIATNGTSSAYDRYYQAYGIAFYDFKVTPLADEDLAFITAAEGYDSLDAAEEDNAPGVEYNDTGSGTPNTSYISNPSASDTTVSASYSETSSTTVSNYMESSETYTFGQTAEISTEFGVSFPLVTDSKMSVSLGFSAEQAISTAYGTEKSLTKEITTETVAEVNLPAHTQIGITQNSGSAEIKLDYDCPVYITYKTVVFGINAQFYWNDTLGDDYWETANYDQGSICIGFGSDTSAGGLTAVDNLYNRAIKFKDMAGFEASYGNNFGRYEHQGDGNDPVSFTAVNWNGFIGSKTYGSSLTTKECVEGLKFNTPLSASGGTMSIKSTRMNTDITGIIPLYNLDYVQLDGSGVYTIAPGGTVDFSKIATAGFNKHNVPYYGYISDGGRWVLCNADGTEITSVDGAKLDDISNYQVFTGEKTGTYYVKFLIDETLYDKVDFEDKITNSDLSSTPIVKINVTETGLDHICAEGPWQTTVAPTCTTEGEQHANCVTCGRVMYTQTVEKLDHIPVTVTTPATCTSEGKVTEICGVCLGLISSKVIDKLSHEFGYETITREPTCVANGEKSIYCGICNEVYATEQIETSGHGTHVYVTTIQPTCTLSGEKQEICSVCNALLGTQEIAPLEHKPGKWEITKDATCTESGLMQQVCAYCDILLGEPVVIDPHEHQAGGWVTYIEADCETAGEKTKSCTVCKGVLETEVIPAIGHSYSDWHTNNNGTHSKSCSICHDTETNNCQFKSTVTASTCTESGITTHVCEICAFTYTDAYTEPLGHLWGEWKDNANGESHTRECLRDNCDVSETHTHNWSEWTDNEDGELFSNGTKTRNCHDCGATETAEAEHTSFFGRIFYPVIVFLGNIVHKIIWIFSLNWLFPELTITPQI